jgi:hypothetical protein
MRVEDSVRNSFNKHPAVCCIKRVVLAACISGGGASPVIRKVPLGGPASIVQMLELVELRRAGSEG